MAKPQSRNAAARIVAQARRELDNDAVTAVNRLLTLSTSKNAEMATIASSVLTSLLFLADPRLLHTAGLEGLAESLQN